MFGPDKCGTFNKVHLILQYQNPISKRWGEMHYNTTIPIKTDKIKFHLYTFHLKSNNDFEIYIDMKSAGKGNLLTHLDPPINPAKEIEDKDDRQPTGRTHLHCNIHTHIDYRTQHDSRMNNSSINTKKNHVFSFSYFFFIFSFLR